MQWLVAINGTVKLNGFYKAELITPVEQFLLELTLTHRVNCKPPHIRCFRPLAPALEQEGVLPAYPGLKLKGIYRMGTLPEKLEDGLAGLPRNSLVVAMYTYTYQSSWWLNGFEWRLGPLLTWTSPFTYT